MRVNKSTGESTSTTLRHTMGNSAQQPTTARRPCRRVSVGEEGGELDEGGRGETMWAGAEGGLK